MRSSKASPTGFIFGDMGKYWAQIANASATEKQLTFVQSIFEAAKGLILDLGCGTGRHTVPLCMTGYNMIGLDLSRDLLQMAKSRATTTGALRVCTGRYAVYAFSARRICGVISLDTSFGYSPSVEGDLQVLHETKRVLADRGKFLIDVFNLKHMIQRYHQKVNYKFEFWLWISLLRFIARYPSISGLIAGLFKCYEYPDFYLLQRRMADAKSGILSDLWLIKDKQDGQMGVYVHIVQLYDLAQMQNLLRKANLDPKQIYGNYKAETYTKTSNKLIIVAQ